MSSKLYNQLKPTIERLDERVVALEEGGTGGDSGGADVPSEVRQAIYNLFNNNAFSNGSGYNADIAVLQAWATEVSSVTVSETELGLVGEATRLLTATTVPSGGIVSWSTSNPLVATVSSDGLVTSVGNGNAKITASCGSKRAVCNVTVSGFASLTGITATYTQSGPVYDTETLDKLKTNLVVVARYDDGTSAEITGYSLSGTLTEGNSTITVAYSGFVDTFTVIVSAYSTDPIISAYGKSIGTNGNPRNTAGMCYTETYTFEIDRDRLKETPYYDSEQEYMKTSGTIFKMVCCEPSTDITFGSGGRHAIYDSEGALIHYWSPTRNASERTYGDNRYETQFFTSQTNNIGVKFSLVTEDIDDVYAYLVEPLSGIMPVGHAVGDIIFAGKNTPYYGMHNISEAAT